MAAKRRKAKAEPAPELPEGVVGIVYDRTGAPHYVKPWREPQAKPGAFNSP